MPIVVYLLGAALVMNLVMLGDPVLLGIGGLLVLPPLALARRRRRVFGYAAAAVGAAIDCSSRSAIPSVEFEANCRQAA